LVVLNEESFIGEARAFELNHRLICAHTVDIAAQYRSAHAFAGIFGYPIHPKITISGHCAIIADLLQTAK
jgi:hypothetical protein